MDGCTPTSSQGQSSQAAAPRGEFCLTDGDTPVVLISAGIGVTPVLAMLYALSAAQSRRDIWWLHTARNPESQAFATEVAGSDRVPAARSPAGVLHADAGPAGSVDDHCTEVAGRRSGIPMRPNPIHGRHARRARRRGTPPEAHSQRIVRRLAVHQPGRRWRGTAHPASSAGRSARRPVRRSRLPAVD